MDRIVSDLHLGAKSAVSNAFVGLRRRGYIILGDASLASLYWVNGTRLTAYQLVALAVIRGVPLNKASKSGEIAGNQVRLQDVVKTVKPQRRHES